MKNIRASLTSTLSFFGATSPEALASTFGSPLYVYNESILRNSCRVIKNLVDLPGYSPAFSTKANGNPHLLRIIREEGLLGDALSPGEVHILHAAGFTKESIHYVCNNVSPDELAFAAENASIASVDSISQLETFGQVNPGARVMVRLNPGIGAGHHQKVITAGKNTKFGISLDDLATMQAVAKQYNLVLAGINQHVGSLFMEGKPYLDAADWLLGAAEHFPDLEYIDFGGGFGIPYRKYDGEAPLDMASFGKALTDLIGQWQKKTGFRGKFVVEPGRFVVAECGLLLGTVHATKNNGPTRYVGTDMGFPVLIRPAMYDSFHDFEIYGDNSLPRETIPQTIVGNICETGDILAKDRDLPEIHRGDLLGVLDAGAYGMSMASNYNQRYRPAEVLIDTDGRARCIRRRDTLDDILAPYLLDGPTRK